MFTVSERPEWKAWSWTPSQVTGVEASPLECEAGRARQIPAADAGTRCPPPPSRLGFLINLGHSDGPQLSGECDGRAGSGREMGFN